MNAFANPQFIDSILSIAQAYGPFDFWTDNLALGMNPDATWRALIVISASREWRFTEPVLRLLASRDSRVRAWACFALGQIRDSSSLEYVYAMNADPSNRVRVHAWQAVQAIVGLEESARRFPIRIPTSESLVLISEDSEKMQYTLASLFENMGFRIAVASSEKETVELAQKLKPQAIITDTKRAKTIFAALT